MSDEPRSPYWTVDETAAYLRISPRTVLDMCKRGQLQFIRTGRTKGTRIVGASVLALLPETADVEAG